MTRTKQTTTNDGSSEKEARALGALELRDVDKTYSTRRAAGKAVDGFSLSVEPGQFVTLLGPSGCGKTTTLRMIAGFETPTGGDILIDGRSVVSVAPNKRPMSMVFQSYALFPHLNVQDNVGFGLTARHASKIERKRRVDAVMELMGIAQYAVRYPHELSGGQQQRVALARAVVMEPSILLFDEPLSNLDAKLRVRMREEIRGLQQRLGITSVFVTHDQSEAMTMSDIVVVMKDGRIRQVGTPQDIYHRPADTFVASFLGTANFLDAVIDNVEEVDGASFATMSIGSQTVIVPCADDVVAGESTKVLIRSENLHIISPEASAGGHAFPGTIRSTSFDGSITRYTVDTLQGVLHGQAPGTETPIGLGASVRCVYDPSDAWVVGERE
ncbi:ABC transporter ATP-binding protein [Microbacterium sp. LWH11-1.2]|uniref:ABC transporter ATP-binding protein n=1 Tax=Microbacterium sp. LWH11-1.2 TaxID=3135258 RepID=UPI003138B5D4